MRLFIAEKPSLGRAIAQGIKSRNPKLAAEQGDGFIKLGDDVVSWCFGHILELAPPAAYDVRWEKWDLANLPIAVSEDQWIVQPKDEAKAQLGLLRTLLSKASVVVNAGDPDREGQLLVDEVLEYLGWKGQTKRVLIFDQTAKGIGKALDSMRDNHEFANLYAAALCRSRADWLVGMNFTRAASKRIGLTASIGRVQTPTLALIVKRDLLIEGHSKSYFYTLHAKTAAPIVIGERAATALVMSHEDDAMRITEKAEAERIAAAITGSNVRIQMQHKRVMEGAPKPFTLATFHKAGEAMHGWSATEALKVLQELYEKKLVSYPRTGCAYLPEDQAPFALEIATNLLATGMFPEAARLKTQMQPSKTVYNDKKVEEHHGVVPTQRALPDDLSPRLLAGWKLVAERFLCSLLPAYAALEKQVSFEAEGRVFKATAHTALNLDSSWRAVVPPKGENKSIPLDWADGAIGPGRVQAVELKQGSTTPPKRYTESSLVDDMEDVAKFVSDPRLKAILKENAGIGTPATQGAIIETLKARGYITTEKATKVTYLKSTPFGRYLIEHMPPILCDVGVTATWESQLDRIAKGEAASADFMVKIAGYVNKYVDVIRNRELPTPPAVTTPKDKAAKVAAKKGAAKKGVKKSAQKMVA